jgi:hypothetical protein
MTNTIYATFSDPNMAVKAAGALFDNGVRKDHMSIVLPEAFATEHNDWEYGGEKSENMAEHGITTTTAGDAASGAAKGAGIGLAAGILAALASVFIPGVGLVLGGGALAIAIGGAAGTTAAGAVAGGATGYLKDQGVPDSAIEDYHRILGSGGALMTITPTDETVSTSTIEGIIVKYNGNLTFGATQTINQASLY